VSAALVVGATQADKLELYPRQNKPAQPQASTSMTSPTLPDSSGSPFMTVNPTDEPTGTAGVESLLARRITMPPSTLAAIIAVAVAFFVSVGTAVAYCLRKSTAAHRAFGADLESKGNSKKPASGVTKKKSLIDTKNTKGVKPVEIQVKVEVVGPTTVSSITHGEDDDSDNEDGAKRTSSVVAGKKETLTLTAVPALNRHARMALAARGLAEDDNKHFAEAIPRASHSIPSQSDQDAIRTDPNVSLQLPAYTPADDIATKNRDNNVP
jgi:hypothetical protein